MRSIGGRGSEGAVVCYCFGEEKGAEEEEKRLGSVMVVRRDTALSGNCGIFTFPMRSSWIFFQLRLDLVPWLRSVECTVNVGLD